MAQEKGESSFDDAHAATQNEPTEVSPRERIGVNNSIVRRLNHTLPRGGAVFDTVSQPGLRPRHR
jgi:hypothetical protein